MLAMQDAVKLQHELLARLKPGPNRPALRLGEARISL